MMKTQLEQRLKDLKNEFQAGQKMLEETQKMAPNSGNQQDLEPRMSVVLFACGNFLSLKIKVYPGRLWRKSIRNVFCQDG